MTKYEMIEQDHRQAIETEAEALACRIAEGATPQSFRAAGYATALDAAKTLVGDGHPQSEVAERAAEILAEKLWGDDTPPEVLEFRRSAGRNLAEAAARHTIITPSEWEGMQFPSARAAAEELLEQFLSEIHKAEAVKALTAWLNWEWMTTPKGGSK